MNHRERLIAAGLYKPLSDDSLYTRNSILQRMDAGENIKDAPIFCVFRRDKPFAHIILDPPRRCEFAELIADKLYSYEAHRLCDRLNFHDPEQPSGRSGHYLGMYGIAVREDWEQWEAESGQLSMEEWYEGA